MYQDAGTLDVQGSSKIQPSPSHVLESLACLFANSVCHDYPQHGRVLQVEHRVGPHRVLGEHRPALDLDGEASGSENKDQVSRGVGNTRMCDLRPHGLEGILKKRDRLIRSVVHGSSIREAFGVREAPNAERVPMWGEADGNRPSGSSSSEVDRPPRLSA